MVGPKSKYNFLSVFTFWPYKTKLIKFLLSKPNIESCKYCNLIWTYLIFIDFKHKMLNKLLSPSVIFSVKVSRTKEL